MSKRLVQPNQLMTISSGVTRSTRGGDWSLGRPAWFTNSHLNRMTFRKIDDSVLLQPASEVTVRATAEATEFKLAGVLRPNPLRPSLSVSLSLQVSV